MNIGLNIDPNTTAVIISVAIAVLAVAFIVILVVSKIRRLSRTLFGTSSLIDGIQGVKNEQEQMRETPRSLHGMTSVYMPMIKRDFPELDVEQYMNKTRSLLRNYFTAVESQKLGAIAEEVTPNFKNYVQGIIDQLASVANTQHYEDVNIYDVQIARYIKNGATVTILFEASVGYFSYVTDMNDNVIFGSRDNRMQTIYEVGLMYVQDVDLLHNRATALGVNCPNCGAPVKTLGEKYCQFCGTAIKEINIRSWKFNSVNEQTLQQRKF